MATDILGIGLTGLALTDLERRLLRQGPPFAVVLFGRNIESEEQLRGLVAEVRREAGRAPLFMIDQEGGRVDRLRNLVPGLPGAETVGRSDRAPAMAAGLGRVIGTALRWFDIEVDLAPVVDIEGEAPARGLERRMFGREPRVVTELAAAFLRGLHERGAAGCLKHWPGIGNGSADPHYGATVIDTTFDELRDRELVPYERLARDARAVMIGHGTYPRIEPEAGLPASLSSRLSTDLLRGTIGFDGLAVSDDMEMHAVSDLGSWEEITEHALMAGNDAILFCSQVERMAGLGRYLQLRAAADESVRARIEQARRRCDAYRAHCAELHGSAPVPASFAQVLDEAARFAEEFGATRNDPPAGGTGTTGREEWT